jgi:hypothetical protein
MANAIAPSLPPLKTARSSNALRGKPSGSAGIADTFTPARLHWINARPAHILKLIFNVSKNQEKNKQ